VPLGVARGASLLVLTAVTVVAVAALLLLAIGPRTGGYRTLTMLSGSMRPAYPPGAVLIDRPLAASELRVGQVLTYQIPVEDHRVVSHRVISVRASGDGVDIQTKGDANNGPDPWVAHLRASRLWVVRAALPRLGWPLLWLRSPRLHRVLLYWIPASALVWLLVGLWWPGRTDDPS